MDQNQSIKSKWNITYFLRKEQISSFANSSSEYPWQLEEERRRA